MASVSVKGWGMGNWVQVPVFQSQMHDCKVSPSIVMEWMEGSIARQTRGLRSPVALLTDMFWWPRCGLLPFVTQP